VAGVIGVLWLVYVPVHQHSPLGQTGRSAAHILGMFLTSDRVAPPNLFGGDLEIQLRTRQVQTSLNLPPTKME
jgi:hypothetical protein